MPTGRAQQAKCLHRTDSVSFCKLQRSAGEEEYNDDFGSVSPSNHKNVLDRVRARDERRISQLKLSPTIGELHLQR